jgi:nucleoside-diphosphate-sugar epimerase
VTRAAVWGAGGFAGARLAEAAAAQGWSVRRLQRGAGDEALALDSGASEAGMAAALEGAEIAFHCAGRIAETDPAGHAGAAGRFARACASAGVRRLVYLSTVAVYGPRRSGEIGTDAPLVATDTYAASRIEAEVAIAAALAGEATAWSIVRVPMLVGPGMPGSALLRFFAVLRTGVFPHPGPEDATLPCLGVRRLAAILLRLPGEGNATLQFADNLRWTGIARRFGELRRRRILRVPLPALPGRLGVLASTARYADDCARLHAGSAGLPSTWEDIDALLRP